MKINETKAIKLAPKRRRKRRTSIDAQIMARAREIQASGMAAAMNAAIGQLVLEKLTDIQSLLGATGYQVSAGPPLPGIARTATAPPPLQQPKVEHPCTQCGREGVYRTRPNKFNPQGSWYCAAHQGLGGRSDLEDHVDATSGLIQGPPLKNVKPPPVITVMQPPPPPEAHAPAAPTLQQAAEDDVLKQAMGLAEIADT
jgi:hypothetical protein